MKKIPKIVLREKQVLTRKSMGHLVGGYDLPEVVIYGYYRHTGDPSECPICKKKMPGVEDWGNMKALTTYGLWIECSCKKGKY